MQVLRKVALFRKPGCKAEGIKCTPLSMVWTMGTPPALLYGLEDGCKVW